MWNSSFEVSLGSLQDRRAPGGTHSHPAVLEEGCSREILRNLDAHTLPPSDDNGDIQAHGWQKHHPPWLLQAAQKQQIEHF